MTTLKVDRRRCRVISDGVTAPSGNDGVSGPVLYWMSRDQRAEDNWALLRAIELATAAKFPCIVAFCLTPTFLGATYRHYNFMLRGLRETEHLLRQHGLPLFLLRGQASDTIPRFVK